MNNDIIFAMRNAQKLSKNQPLPPKVPKENFPNFSGEHLLLKFIKTHKYEKAKRIY